MGKNAANALLSNRIRVNGVAPGWMDTPAEDAIQKTYHAAPDNWLEMAEATMPMGQLAKPDQLAPIKPGRTRDTADACPCGC